MESSRSGYISEFVESEYERRYRTKNRELSNAVLEHRQDVEKSGKEGLLDQLDIRDLRNDHLDPSSEAYQGLLNWYGQLPQQIQKSELTERLKNISRDIKKDARERKTDLDQEVSCWDRTDSYRSIESKIDGVPSDDRRICLDAHDVAASNSGNVILVTTNPTHLKEDGREESICSSTFIEMVEDIAQRN